MLKNDKIRLSTGDYKFEYDYKPYYASWHHIVYSYDQKYVRLYIDNKLIGKEESDFWTDADDHQLCDYYGHLGNHDFKGLIDDLQIYNFALSDEEIRQIYVTKKPVEVCNNKDDDGDGRTDEDNVCQADCRPGMSYDVSSNRWMNDYCCGDDADEFYDPNRCFDTPEDVHACCENPDHYVDYFGNCVELCPNLGGVDKDNDGYDSIEFGGDDCDDDNPYINPGVEDVCDGIDNNCDDNIDEGCDCVDGATKIESCGKGECYKEIELLCVMGEWDKRCIALEKIEDEICDDGLDNDCDSVTDSDDDDCNENLEKDKDKIVHIQFDYLTKIFNEIKNDHSHGELTPDGGYVIGGYSGVLLKADSKGDKQWMKTFKIGDTPFYLRSFTQTTDGGYILTGNNGKNAKNLFVIKTDSKGNTCNVDSTYNCYINENKWVKFLKNEQLPPRAIIQTVDRGYIILCGVTQGNILKPRPRIIKIDSKGNILNEFEFGSDKDTVTSLQQTSNQGLIVTSIANIEDFNYYAGRLIKIRKNGKTQWTKNYDGNIYGYDAVNFAHQTTDGGYILTGTTQSYGKNKGIVWLIKTDSYGNTCNYKNQGYCFSNQNKWVRTFTIGTLRYGGGKVVKQTMDGGYILAATYNNRSLSTNMLLIKTDKNGYTCNYKKGILKNTCYYKKDIKFNNCYINKNKWVQIISLGYYGSVNSLQQIQDILL